jgi:hypothetical protein
MKLGELNGYEFHVPTSGGKAGKGCNRTSTIQLRMGNRIIKQFRFTLDDPASRTKAIRKAKAFAMEGK